MANITKDMTIAQVLEMDRGTTPILFKHGLNCLGCAMASGESLEEACMVHWIDCDALIGDLNEYFDSKES